MGMTIDEAEQYLIALKYCETCEATDTNICKTCSYHRKGSSAKCYDAIDVAIDTMRKYQKIQKIVNSKTTRLSYDTGFIQIRKVTNKKGEI